MKNTTQILRKVLPVLIFQLVFWQLAASQPDYPPLPEGDYTIYSAIVNEFSTCSDSQSVYRRNQLLFIKTVTQVRSKYSFHFNFAKAQENLAFLVPPKGLLPPQEPFYKEPRWQTFIASVDTNQFVRYEIKHPLELECRKSQLWSSQLEEYYFGKENRRDYYALRNDYTNFGSIITFSKVAYSPDQQKALCYYSTASDGRSGAGHLIFLERKESGWKIVGIATLWVA